MFMVAPKLDMEVVVQVTLYSKRTASPGTASGIPIGVARVYDMQLKNDSYSGADTIFVLSLRR